MSPVGAILGSFFGLLAVGALAKLFPGHDLLFVQAGIVAIGCIVGVALEWNAGFNKKKNE